MPEAHLQKGEYNFDFRDAPNTDHYRFSNDIIEEEKEGPFMELPITTNYYTPMFFWELYVKGRLNRKKHRMMGDGTFIAQPGAKTKGLTTGKTYHASTDGYFAKELQSILDNKMANGESYMVTIGHPKSCTVYSMKKLEAFIEDNVEEHQFIKMSQVL